MINGLVVGVVPGVTPDTWVRTWRDRMGAAQLRIEPIGDAEAGPALTRTDATRLDLVFARLPLTGIDPGDVHVIPLWQETPLAVAAKDHPIRVFDAVTLAELAGETHYPGWDDATLDIVAAGHGFARMPQSVLRSTGRRDLIGRPISDAEPTRIALVWKRSSEDPLVEEFVGIVRGRTSNSSRGAPTPPAAVAKAAPKAAAKPSGAAKHPAAPRTRRGSTGRSTKRGR